MSEIRKDGHIEFKVVDSGDERFKQSVRLTSEEVIFSNGTDQVGFPKEKITWLIHALNQMNQVDLNPNVIRFVV